METVKEIFQSIYDSYRDRIKSPLVGSFIVTYLIFNWRLVAILFYSEWAIHCRIEWIEENYCNWYNYIIPFGLALFYVLGLPYLNLGFDKILTNYSDTQLDKKNKAKINKLIQKVEEAKEERKIADAKAGTSEINNLNAKIESLQKEISILVENNKTDSERWNQQNSESHDKIKELQKLINARDIEINSLENLRNKENVFLNTLNDENKLNKIINVARGLTEKERNTLVNMYISNNKKMTHNISLTNFDILEKFQNLGIVIINGDTAHLTSYGQEVVDFIRYEIIKK